MLMVLVAGLLTAHTAGISQGTVTLSRSSNANPNNALVVDVELVFARSDAARLAEPIITANACTVNTSLREDVEEDGHAIRIALSCTSTPVEIDVVGLSSLPDHHRLMLRTIDDGGDSATMLWPQHTTHTLTLHAPPTPAHDATAITAALTALIATMLGARARRAALITGALVVGGGVIGLMVPMTVPPIAISIVALCAVLSTVADRTPRVRIIALAVGVALASLC